MPLMRGSSGERGGGALYGLSLSMARTDFHTRRGNMLEQAFWGRCLVERAAAFSVYNRGSRIRKLNPPSEVPGQTGCGKDAWETVWLSPGLAVVSWTE
jgi:hypothetical protein